MSNHLGNVLTTVTDVKIPVDGKYQYVGTGGNYRRTPSGYASVTAGTGDYNQLEAPNTTIDNYLPYISNASDFYAFGELMPGRGSAFATTSRHLFNGKEQDVEMYNIAGTSYDFGDRIYNPRLGRWLSVDPLSKKFPMLTPYQYGSLNPIWNIDLDGLESVNYNLLLPNFLFTTKLTTTTAKVIDKTANATVTGFNKADQFMESHKGSLSNDTKGFISEGHNDASNIGTFSKEELQGTAKALDYTGTGLKVAGYAGLIFSGAGAPLIEGGEILSKAADVIQAGIDIKEGNYGKAAVNVGFNVAGYKLGKTIDKSLLKGTDKEIIKTGADLKVDLLKKATEATIDEKEKKK